MPADARGGDRASVQHWHTRITIVSACVWCVCTGWVRPAPVCVDPPRVHDPHGRRRRRLPRRWGRAEDLVDGQHRDRPEVQRADCGSIVFRSPTTTTAMRSGWMYCRATRCTSAAVTASMFWHVASRSSRRAGGRRAFPRGGARCRRSFRIAREARAPRSSSRARARRPAPAAGSPFSSLKNSFSASAVLSVCTPANARERARRRARMSNATSRAVACSRASRAGSGSAASENDAAENGVQHLRSGSSRASSAARRSQPMRICDCGASGLSTR